MAKFVLTAELNLKSPGNIGQVVNQIQRELNGINLNIAVKNPRQTISYLNEITSSSNKATTSVQKMGDAFGVSLKRFAVFSIASRGIGLFSSKLSAAIEDAISFQNEIVRLSQVTGESIKSFTELTNQITRLSTTLGVSSKELLSVATILAQAGLNAKDTEIAVNALAKTALAPTFGDIRDTAEGAVAVIAQFGEGVEALERQLGSINEVSAKFAVESEDLIAVIRRTGGVFKASGGSLEELLALFTSVRATTRESAETIATGLRTIFTRIQRPATIEYLKQFGVNLTDLEGKFVGPYEAIRQLSEAIGSLEEGDVRFIQIAEELGGFRQIGKVIPLLRQFELAEKARQAAVAGGESLTQDAITAQQSLAVQFTKVREEFLSLIRGISETATFQVLVKTTLSLTSALISLADSLKPVIPLLGALAAIKFASNIGSFVQGIGAGFGRTVGPTAKNAGGKIHAFARGGLVPGTGNRDTVPAMLSPGEFVIRKSSVNKIGADKLAAMNENRYANGGPVLASELPSQELRKRVKNANSSEARNNPEKFENGEWLTNNDKITFTKIEYGLKANKNISPSNFETKVANITGGTKATSKIAPVDILGKRNKYFEVRNRARTTSDKVLLDKFLRQRILENKYPLLIKNQIKSEPLTFADPVQVVYSTGKLPNKNFIDLEKAFNKQKRRSNFFGGLIRQYATGTKGRGVEKFTLQKLKGPPLTPEELERWQELRKNEQFRKYTSSFSDTRTDLFKNSQAEDVRAAFKGWEKLQTQEAAALDTLPRYGAAFLKKDIDIGKYGKLTDTTGREFALKTLYMGEDDSQRIQNDVVKNGAIDLINSVATYMLNAIGGGKATGATTTPNLAGITGSIFEAALRKIDDLPGDGDPDKLTFDFPSGLGPNAAKIFGADSSKLFGLKTDAKFSSSNSARDSIRDKVTRDLDESLSRSIRKKGQEVRSTKKYFGGIVKKFAVGGNVGTDTVPALLTPGEFVINRSSAQRIGYGNLNAMNKKGVSKFARGGAVGVQKFETGGKAALTKAYTQKKEDEERAAKVSANIKPIIEYQKSKQADIKSVIMSEEQTQEGKNQFISGIEKKIQSLESLPDKTDDVKDKLEFYYKVLSTAVDRQQSLTKSIDFLKEQYDSSVDVEKYLQSKKEAAIQQAQKSASEYKGLKQKTLRPGTQSTYLESMQSAESTVKEDKALKAQQKAEVAAKIQEQQIQRSQKIFNGLAIAGGLVITSLNNLKPTIDENSSSLAKGFAFIVDKANSLIVGIGTVGFALSAFGIQLDAQAAKMAATNIADFFTGGGKVANKAGDFIKGAGNKLSSFGKASSNVFISKASTSTGNLLLSLGSTVTKVITVLGPLIASAAIAGTALYGLQNIIDSTRGVFEKYNQSLKDADLKAAVAAKVQENNAKRANILGLIFVGLGAAVGAVIGVLVGWPVLLTAAAGAFIGAIVGLVVKLEFFTNALAVAADYIRNSWLGQFLGFDTTEQIKSQQRATAAMDIYTANVEKNAQEQQKILDEIKSGESNKTVASAFKSGEIGKNLSNALIARSEQIKSTTLNKNDDFSSPGTVISQQQVMQDLERKNVVNQKTGKTEKETDSQMRERLTEAGYRREDINNAIKNESQVNEEFQKLKPAFGDLTREIVLASGETTGFNQLLDNLPDDIKNNLKATGLMDDLEKEFDKHKKAIIENIKYLQSLNFGLREVSGAAAASVLEFQNSIDSQKTGFNQFQQSSEILKAGMTNAATGIKEADFDKALENLRSSITRFGGTEEQAASAVSAVKAVNTAQKVARDVLEETKAQRVKDPKMSAQTTAEFFQANLRKRLEKSGEAPEAIERVIAGFKQIKFQEDDLKNLAGSNYSALIEQGLGGLQKQLEEESIGIAEKRAQEEEKLIGLIQERISLEKSYNDARKQAIEIELEAAQLIEEFGGKKVTPQDRLSSLNRSFSVDLEAAGVGPVNYGTASEVMKAQEQIFNAFEQAQEAQASAAAKGTGAFGGATGAEKDKRLQLEAAQQELVNYARKRIDLIKAEISLAEKKNELEKSAIDKLLGGDVEGYIQERSAAGAASALRSGNAQLANLFGGQAMGAGLQSLKDQGLTSKEMESAASIALKNIGGTTAMAQVYSNNTPELQNLQQQGQEFANILSQAGDNFAKMQNMKIQATTVIIDAKNAEIKNAENKLNSQQQNNSVNGNNNTNSVNQSTSSPANPAVDTNSPTKVDVSLAPSTVNVNLNGGSFLGELTKDVRNNVLTAIKNEIERNLKLENDGKFRFRAGV